MDTSAQSKMRETIFRLYEEMDSGRFPAELFTLDFQSFYPKFGVGHGTKAFLDFVGKVQNQLRVKRVMHHLTELLFVEEGKTEGTTEGTTYDGAEWRSGKTTRGPFPSVFAFTDAGLIDRMHAYLDPDFVGNGKISLRGKVAGLNTGSGAPSPKLMIQGSPVEIL